MSKKEENSKPEEGNMSLSGHLKEMRTRIIICLVALVIGIGVCLGSAPKIVTLLTDMGTAYDYQYIYIAPQELLMVYFSVALLGGIVVALPVLAYQVYAFCSPGLTRKEKILFLSALVSGAACFCVGVLFAYHITLPFMLRFLIQFSDDIVITASITIEKYMNFLLTVFVIFGAVFELPVISVILTALGLLRPEWMLKSRRVMIVVIFVVAAIITPPDIVSQIMVAVPMIGLYEISIILCRICSKMKHTNKETS